VCSSYWPTRKLLTCRHCKVEKTASITNFSTHPLESVPVPRSHQPAAWYHCLSLLLYRDPHGTVAWAASLCRILISAHLPLSGNFSLQLLPPLLKTGSIPSSWPFLALRLHSGDHRFHFVDVPLDQGLTEEYSWGLLVSGSFFL